MNSYNENLNATVRAVLSELELNQEKLQAQKEAATFTHYFAKEAIAAALKKSTAINALLVTQQSVVEKTTGCHAISSAVLSSANEANTLTKLAVTNSAVAASNIQVAANAIVRLASDMESVYSIINSADFDTDIYQQANTAHQLMNDTGAVAETASELAMQASVYSSEIASAILSDKAKSTNLQALGLLNVLTAQYNTTKEQQLAISSELNKAIDTEKTAQEELEKITLEYSAVLEGYLVTIQELNLGLKAEPSEDRPESYTVAFKEYVNPFPGTEKDQDPVEGYYILLVKDSKKTTFSPLHAAECITRPGQFIQVKKKANRNTPFKKEIMLRDLLDTDGDSMQGKEPYVVFVMIQLKEEYKRRLNNFEDLLTAPSAVFRLNTPSHSVMHTSLSGKQKQLSALGHKVLSAQLKVNERQEIVTALTEKAQYLQEILNEAGAGRNEAENTKNNFDQLVQSALDLKEDSLHGLDMAKKAKKITGETAKLVGNLTHKLIFNCDIIQKLAGTLVRKKVVNPLISDELITTATTACKNADNAITLTFVSLKSAFGALDTITGTEAIMALECLQAGKFCDALTLDQDPKKLSLLSPATLLGHHYAKSKNNFKATQTAYNKITKRLSSDTQKLGAAKINLNSLQFGLAAANAAALAT